MLSFMRTDAGLVQSVLAGRVDRFDELMRRHFNTAYGIAFSYTHNHADAEDLCQDAFLKAYQSLDRLEEPKKFGHWLSVITRNLARNWYQRHRREGVAILEMPKPGAADAAGYDDMRELLTNQMQKLDPIPREVLMRHYFADQSTSEIAKTMGVSQAAVLKRLQRARKVLGARLIHELKLIPAAENDSAERRRKIMGAITATGLTWKLGGGGVSSAAAGVLANAKVIVGATIITGAIGAAAFTMSNRNGSELSQSQAAVSVAASGNQTGNGQARPVVVSTDEEHASDLEAERRPDDALVLAQLDDAEGQADTAEGPEVLPDPVIDLSGDWRLSIGTLKVSRGDDQPQPELVGTVRLIRDGDALEVAGLTEVIKTLGAEGRIEGNEISLDLFSVVRSDYGEKVSTVVGEFNSDEPFFELVGDAQPEGIPAGEWQLVMRFERVTEGMPTDENARELAEQRLRAIRDGIYAYVKEYGAGPVTLSQLTEEYLPEQSHLVLNDRQELTYTQPMYDVDATWERIREEISKLESWELFLQTEDPGFIIDYEEDVAAIWGDYFPGGFEMLYYVDWRHSFALSMTNRGSIRVEATDGQNGDSISRQRAREAQTRTSCANNLKKLGLVFKMFENENPIECIPAGFRHVHPKYLTDPAVVTCPTDEVGTISYEVPYPASSVAFWEQVYDAVEGQTEDDGATRVGSYQSRVPMIVENHPCAGEHGRHVLFVDGHVELVTNDAWAQRMAPYLEYAY